MSDSDGFIEEVTEELRRERLFATMKKYGGIAALVALVVIGGVAWSEYRKAQAVSAAQDLGDALLSALQEPDATARAARLEAIEAETPAANAVLAMLKAGQQVEAGNVEAAVAGLDSVAGLSGVPQVYREIAGFKSATLQTGVLPSSERRQRFEALAQPGSLMRLLAEEQIALIDIEEGDAQAAIDRYQAILSDAEVTPDLQERAVQVIVALGGAPDFAGAPSLTEAPQGN